MAPRQLYFNANVYTMDPAVPRAEALVVDGDRIAAVGSIEEVDGPARGAERIDLAGATVIPGFNDSHAHILWLGLALDQVDVSVGAVQSIEDIRRAVESRARQVDPAAWIVGRGYDQNMLADGRHPTRTDLDDVSNGHPVVLQHTSGHVLTCNTTALQQAGVTASSVDPPGGVIHRDEHGEPTGLMKESAMDLVRDAIPQPSTDEGAAAIRDALHTMASHGITSASDAATGTGSSIDDTLRMYERAAASGAMSARVQLMPQIHYVAPPGSERALPPDGITVSADPDWLSVGPTKIFSDGALSTRTAALTRPYSDDASNRGILLWPTDTLESMIGRAHRAGWQIATHALGDRAVEVVTRAYRKALHGAPRPDHRHRIEHCMLVEPDVARGIRDLGIVPSLQPDIFRLGDGYVAGLGYERACASIPVGLFRSLGVRIAFSSDTPVIPCAPLAIIRSSIERRTPSGVQLGTTEASSVAEALRAYTVGGAYATHTDAVKGALRPGMFADFTTLSGDPMAVTVQELDSLKVLMTVAGGQVTYRA